VVIEKVTLAFVLETKKSSGAHGCLKIGYLTREIFKVSTFRRKVGLETFINFKVNKNL
jgi:hypothetical protein